MATKCHTERREKIENWIFFAPSALKRAKIYLLCGLTQYLIFLGLQRCFSKCELHKAHTHTHTHTHKYICKYVNYCCSPWCVPLLHFINHCRTLKELLGIVSLCWCQIWSWASPSFNLFSKVKLYSHSSSLSDPSGTMGMKYDHSSSEQRVFRVQSLLGLASLILRWDY